MEKKSRRRRRLDWTPLLFVFEVQCDREIDSLLFFSVARFSAVFRGIWNTPSSVTTTPVMSALGVMSKAGFHTSIPVVAIHIIQR